MKKRIGKSFVAVGIIAWAILVIVNRKLAQEDLDDDDYGHNNSEDDDDDDPYWDEFYDEEIAKEFDNENEKKDCPHVTMGEVLYHFLWSKEKG